MRSFALTIVMAVSLWEIVGCHAPRRRAHIPWRLIPISVEAPIPVFIELPGAGSPFVEGDVRWVNDAFDDWSKAAEGRIRFSVGSEEGARIRIYWRPATGEYAGEMQTSARRGYRINDVLLGSMWAALPPSLASAADGDAVLRRAIVYRMALHEIGHALGLIHTVGLEDAMYHGADAERYFRRYADRLAASAEDRPSGVSHVDRERLAQLYPADDLLPEIDGVECLEP